MSARVLVVEDEPLVRDLMVEVLTEAGFQVDQAATAEAAIRLLEVDGYQLVVTDVHMPGTQGGIQVAERAARETPALPVVFVTARPDVLDRLNRTGLRGLVLKKPFALVDLLNAVRELVGNGAH